MLCPICRKNNTASTGVPFPSDSARFIRYCMQLQMSPKQANRNFLICFEHFDPKDHIKKGNKVIGVNRLALPKRTRKEPCATSKDTTGMTLDQLLARNVGIDISASPSTSRSESVSTSTPPIIDFNLSQQRAASFNKNPGMGVFGFQNNTNISQMLAATSTASNLFQQQNFTPMLPRQQEELAGITALVSQTLVIYRHKKNGTSPIFDQRYFKEWLKNCFNLPDTAIFDNSQMIQLQNFCIVFIILDERQTLENILAMYNSQSSDPYQCIIVEAKSILIEGTRIEMRNHGYIASSSGELTLENCLNCLLKSRNGGTDANLSMRIDENDWRSVAAAMLPAYRSLVTAALSQQAHQLNNYTTSTPNSSTMSSNGENPQQSMHNK